MPVALLALVAASILIAAIGLTRPVRTAFAALITDGAAWVLHTLVKIAPAVALTLTEGLLTAFEQDRDEWAKVVNVFVKELIGPTVQAADVQQTIAEGGLAAAAPVIAKPLIDAVLAAILPEGDITTDSGPENLNSLVGLNVLLGLQGWWVEAVGDLVSLGRFGAALDLPNAMERSLGLTRLMRLAWRTPIKKGLEEPLTRYYNRRYHFTTYTMAEATAAHHRGLLDDNAFLEAARDLGYYYDKGATLLALAQKTMAEAQVEALWRRGLLQESDAQALIAEQGYGVDRSTSVWEALRGAKGQTLLDSLATTARDLFKAGDLSEDDLRQYLAEAHFQPEEIDLAIQADQLSILKDKPLSDSEVIQALQHGVWTEGQVRGALRKRKYSDESIDVKMALAVRQLSSGQLLDLFSRGKITRDEATARLEKLGYSAEDAASLLDLRTRTLSEGQVLDAFARNLINIDTARVDLQQLGFTPDAIDVLLSFIRKTLSPADVQAALVRGLITPNEALGRLISAGYSRADAQTIVDLRVRLLTTGQILDAYGNDLIDRATALGDLEQRGLTAEEAGLVLGVFEAKKAAAAAKKPPVAPPIPPVPPPAAPPGGP